MAMTTAQRALLVIFCATLAAESQLLAQEGVLRPGSTVYSVIGPTPGDRFGIKFAVLGDANRDGIRDFAVAGHGSLQDFDAQTWRAGHIDLISGRDGSRLRQWHGQVRNDVLGTEVEALPDIDGDGVFELGAFNRSGFLTVLSPVTGETWFTIPRTQQ